MPGVSPDLSRHMLGVNRNGANLFGWIERILGILLFSPIS